MDVSTFADQLFFVTAYLEGSDGEAQWSGTGFVYKFTAVEACVDSLLAKQGMTKSSPSS